MLPVAVARSSSDGVAIRYVLPILWMTLCFKPWDLWADGRARRCVARRHQWTWSLAGRGPLQHTGSAGRLAGVSARPGTSELLTEGRCLLSVVSLLFVAVSNRLLRRVDVGGW